MDNGSGKAFSKASFEQSKTERLGWRFPPLFDKIVPVKSRLSFVSFLLFICLFSPINCLPHGSAPAEAISHVTVPDGLKASLFASEPMVAQPVAIEFDDRGRLWVIQYLQYPNPAGLSRIKVDRYSRTVYDKIPEPPPRGPKGADRITILEDTNGDGRAHKAKDFINGLNLASGLAFG